MKVFYHVVGLEGANEDFKKTVFGKQSISTVKRNIPDTSPYKAEIIRSLEKTFPDGQFNAWGVPAGAKSVIKNLQTGDAVLLVESIGMNGKVPALGIVDVFGPEELKELSKAFWGNERFPFIFFFRTEKLNLTWEEMHRELGFDPNYRPPALFHHIKEERLRFFGGAEGYVKKIRESYSLDDGFLNDINIREVELEIGNVDEEFFDLVEEEYSLIKQKSLSDDPSLTETDQTWQNSKARSRSAAFRVGIKKHYENECAICDVRLAGPDGRIALESAHIYPKERNGSDDLRNGVCLCHMHHWALDAGWLAIRDDFSIIVHGDLPANQDYDFIRKFKDHKLKLPKQIKFAPHPKFLMAHRKLKGFEND